MAGAEIEVRHTAVESLPGGATMMWHYGDGFVHVFMNSQATVAEIAAGMNPMYELMAATVLTLVKKAEVA